MPSREQMAIRRTEAYARLNAGLSGLSERLGIAPADVGSTVKDRDLAAIIEVEQMADAVDAIAERISQGAAPAETDAAEDDDATAPAPAAKGASTPADAQKRPTRARTGTKD
jgi:hypothetical protein